MLDAVDLYSSYRCPFDRRKKRPADRITDRRTEPAFERLSIEFAVPRRQCLGFDIEPTRHLEICPIIGLCHIVLFKSPQSWLCPRISDSKNGLRDPATSANSAKNYLL